MEALLHMYLEKAPRPLQELRRLNDNESNGVPDVIGQRVEVPQVVRIQEGVLLREALELLFQEPGCVGAERRLESSEVRSSGSVSPSMAHAALWWLRKQPNFLPLSLKESVGASVLAWRMAM